MAKFGPRKIVGWRKYIFNKHKKNLTKEENTTKIRFLPWFSNLGCKKTLT
jgi:hypothetical protein